MKELRAARSQIEDTNKQFLSLQAQMKLYTSEVKNTISPPANPQNALVYLAVSNAKDLWKSEPIATGDAIDAYLRIVRQSKTRFDAFEIKSEGDKIFFAFESPLNAVSFALDCQRSLSGFEWP